ncbi:hypothetical protein [Aureimonas mangrovi]|uniref:hypothetical protein n=1 Tax=Aureimonas mangrovi TaxID=2758041 RepID=UPI00163D8CF8|nr:hypothetical protein [Aureimonas mangrovi]
MSDDLTRVSKAELTAILDEAEEQIAAIRSEITRREQMRQHNALDELELPIKRTAVDWTQVRAFFQEVLSELRARAG